MKKRILLLLVLLISILTFTGCSINKKVLTVDDFKSKMGEREYTLSDVTNDYSSVGYIKTAYSASKNDYEINFYEVEDVDKAKESYDGFKEQLEDMDHKSSLEVNIGNHQKYEITTSERYEFITRVDKTMIIVDAKKDNKDEIIETLKAIGYY